MYLIWTNHHHKTNQSEKLRNSMFREVGTSIWNVNNFYYFKINKTDIIKAVSISLIK